MQREHLAIHGTANPSGVPRVELVLDEQGGLELLHASEEGSAGRFGRVLRGFFGAGKLPQPIAIKLERAELPPGVGNVKFINEYNAQISVHRDLREIDRTRVIRLLQMWDLPKGLDCDELPPTIICPRSRQILDPRCPDCRKPLRNDLSCERGCRRDCKQASPEHIAEVLAHSGCPACQEGKVECAKYWLNHRICKLLLLELLDLDLGDYARWRWSETPPPPQRRDTWSKFKHHHLAAFDQRAKQLGHDEDHEAAAFEELKFLLRLFQDALRGAGELHSKRIPHLDLKPANLCLALEGHVARLKVIDLGQADSPQAKWITRLKSIQDDADLRLRGNIFSAPEQLNDRIRPVEVRWKTLGNVYLFLPTAGNTKAADVVCGDWFYLSTDGSERFFRVVQTTDKFFVAQQMRPTDDWEEININDRFAGQNWQGPATIALVQHAGYAADVFALGLLLAFLISRGRVDLSLLRSSVDDVSDRARRIILGKEGIQLPARATIDELILLQDDRIGQALRGVLDLTPKGDIRALYKELLGIVLRATLRGIPSFSYARHRGDMRADAIARLNADLQSVKTRLNLLSQTHDLHSGRVARFRQAGLQRLRAWLRIQKPPAVAANAGRPGYDRNRICDMLDRQGSDAVINEREYHFLLREYGGIIDWLATDLNIFEEELENNLVVAPTVHPVVLRMLETAYPGREKCPVLSELDGTLDRQRRFANKAIDYLDTVVASFDERSGRGDVNHETIEDIATVLESLDELVIDVRRRLRQLSDWRGQLNSHEQELISRWDRLRTDAPHAWQAFSRKVRMHLDKVASDSERWMTSVGDALGSVERSSKQSRAQLVDGWSEKNCRFRRTIRGRFRRFLAWMEWRPMSTRVTIPPAQLAVWRESLRTLRTRMDSVLPMPSGFTDRLSAFLNATPGLSGVAIESQWTEPPLPKKVPSRRGRRGLA